MAKKKTKKMPKTLMIIRESDGDDEYYVAGESPDSFSLNSGDIVVAGIYVLTETVNLINEIRIEK